MNVQELDRVIKFIEDNPDKHDQTAWIEGGPGCKTTACLAGWTAMLNGWEPVPANTDRWCDGLVQRGTERRAVGFVARQVLGLSDTEGHALFYNAKTLADIKAYRNKVAAP